MNKILILALIPLVLIAGCTQQPLIVFGNEKYDSDGICRGKVDS